MADRVRKVVKNTGFQILGKVVTVISTVFITALITRAFGKDGYGLFTLMTTFPAYFYLVVDFGINAIVVRKVGSEPEKLGDYFRNLFTFRFFFSLFVFLMLVVLLPFIPFRTGDISLLRLGILISALTIITQALYLSGNAVFQKVFRYDLSNIALTLGNFFTLILTLLFLRMNLSIIFPVVASVLGSVFTVLYMFYLLRPFVGKIKHAFIFPIWREFLRPALPLGFSLFVMVVLAKSDMFLLSIIPLPKALGYDNTEALGLYGLAYKVFENALVVPTFFINSLYPLLIEDNLVPGAKLRRTVFKSGIFLFLTGLLLAIIGIVFAPLMVEVLGGTSFSQSIFSLRILLLSLPIFFPSALFVWLLVTLHKEKFLFPIYLFGAIFNIVANIFYIPKYGFLASAVITGITEVIVISGTVILGIIFLRRKERYA